MARLSEDELYARIASFSREEEAFVKECRRTVHRYAETAGREVKTSALVKEQAEGLGLAVESVSRTGLIATLDTGKPGNTVALRADMDALPIPEAPENMCRLRTVVSEDPGTSHACGHDAHTAMLLGAMRVLCRLKEELSGKVLFCFEEGEETGSGMEGMLRALLAKHPNTVFGLHVLSSLEHGILSVEPGPRMSGIVDLNAVFVGKGGHGSRPDLAVNPVYAAANAVCNLTVACANQITAGKTVTLGITDISGSGANNVIADKAKVLGSMRFFDPEEGRKAAAILRNVFTHTAQMHGCTVEYKAADVLLDPVINDPDAAALAEEALKKVLPADCVGHSEPWYASESFSLYLTRFKGALGFLGVRNEKLGCCAEHHTRHFDLDETALVRGVTAHAAYAAAALTSSEVGNWKEKQPAVLYEEG